MRMVGNYGNKWRYEYNAKINAVLVNAEEEKLTTLKKASGIDSGEQESSREGILRPRGGLKPPSMMKTHL